MDARDRPQFASDLGSSIYQYVERHGTAARHRVREEVSASIDEFQSELERLTEEGYLHEDGGTLRVGLDLGSVERHATDDGETRYVIRPARHEDFEGLVGTIRAVTDETTYVVAETVAEQLLYEEAVTRHNTVESRVFFVAAVDGEIVGWTHLDLPQVKKRRDTAQLTVGVRPESRRRGIGGRLLERGLDWAEANGYRKLYNGVPAINDEALSFLDGYGWHTEGIRRGHYTIDDEHVDEVLMAYEY